MCSAKTWFQRRERVYGFSTEVRCAPHVIELDAPDCLACMEPWFQSARMVRIAGVDIMSPQRCGGRTLGCWRGGGEKWTGCHGTMVVWRMGRGVVEGR